MVGEHDAPGEDAPPGSGFLAEVTHHWEREIASFEELKLRVVTLRIGIVLSKRGGALPKLAQSIRMNLGAVLGSGKQYMSWIHIDDLCGVIAKAIDDNKLVGIFNVVAPDAVTNEEFTRSMARVMKNPLWLPAVPGWALTIMLGEMAQLVLGGNRVSANKIGSFGYEFKFDKLLPALEELLG